MNRLMNYVLVERRVVECPDLMQWAQWYEAAHKDGSFRVGETVVRELRVSTVFLGIDHRFLGDGPPIVFETMVFNEIGEGRERYAQAFDECECMQRYCTYAEAEQGHEAIVEMLRHVQDAAIEITRSTLAIIRSGASQYMDAWRDEHKGDAS